MSNLASIVHDLGARRSGSGFMGKCPAHEDRKPSLSIAERNGKVLFHCHAGCSQESVLDALKSRALWEESAEPPARPRIVDTYDYTDENGRLLYQIVRYEPKDFKQRRPDRNGDWNWKKHPRQVLYRLPEVLEAPIVFVVEGEKDVETLRGWGFVATTNAGGAKAVWEPEYTECLRGREVILIPDNDEAGRQRAQLIATALVHNTAKLRCLELNGSKDISAWFEQGHSEVELIHLLDGEGVLDD